MSIRKGFKVQRAKLADHVPTPFLVYSNGSDRDSVQTVLITTRQLLAICDGLELLHQDHENIPGVGQPRREFVRVLRADLGQLVKAI